MAFFMRSTEGVTLELTESELARTLVELRSALPLAKSTWRRRFLLRSINTAELVMIGVATLDPVRKALLEDALDYARSVNS